ncbi:MAG: cell filamentation protein Fic [Bacteroidales bacterium]|nr:cell filamentation protein Fic [Bacteroidales bacterium]
MENRGEIVIYHSMDGSTNLEVKLADETIWLTQQQIRVDSTYAKFAHTTNLQILHNTIAESRPEEKDVMVKVVVILINKNNQ